VLTKPDLIGDGKHNNVVSTLLNKTKPLKLGYVMVKVSSSPRACHASNSYDSFLFFVSQRVTDLHHDQSESCISLLIWICAMAMKFPEAVFNLVICVPVTLPCLPITTQ
jgi:hypothetical protein